MEGKFCTRWWVLSATGIALCQWLNLEDGVILKYDHEARPSFPRWLWLWSRTDAAIPITYLLARQANPNPNNWNILITQGACNVAAEIDQELDEQLWTGADDVPFVSFGCGVDDPPIETLNVRSYKTEADALADFPSLQVWDWA